MATGWQKLGEMLAGGGGGDEAYRARMMENARLGTALGQDRALRLKEAALLGLDEALIGLGNSPDQARAFGALGRADLNPEQFTGAGIDLGTRRAQDAAFAAVQGGGGMAAANPYLALQEGKPLKFADIKGDTVFNPYEQPLGQALVTTDLGQARIRERDAGAAENYAQARAAETRAQLNDAKRTNPGSFYDTGGMGGTLGAPTMMGPRNIPIVSTGDKTLDRENWNRVQTGLEALDTIEDLRPLAQDPRNFGITGKLRGAMRDLIAQGDALALQFGGEASRIRDEIKASGSDVDLGEFNEDRPLLQVMSSVLAFKRARALSGPGVMSNQDYKNAAIGLDPTSIFADKDKFIATIDAIERQTAESISRFTPQGHQSLGVPRALADRLGVGGSDTPASPSGRLDPSSAARVIADIEAERGAPLTPEQRQQAIQQLTTGSGQMDMAIPEPRRTLDQMPIGEIGGGAIGGPVPAGGKRRIRFDAQGNQIP